MHVLLGRKVLKIQIESSFLVTRKLESIRRTTSSSIPGTMHITLPLISNSHQFAFFGFAVEPYAAYSPANFAIDGFVSPSATGLPKVLNPGESVIIEMTVDVSQTPWWTEFGYQRRGLRDRVLGWAWNSGNRTIQSWIGPLISDLVFVKCGPITNQPPDTFLQPSDTFLKFIVPRPSVRLFDPALEDFLRDTNAPVRKPTNGL